MDPWWEQTNFSYYHKNGSEKLTNLWPGGGKLANLWGTGGLRGDVLGVSWVQSDWKRLATSDRNQLKLDCSSSAVLDDWMLWAMDSSGPSTNNTVAIRHKATRILPSILLDLNTVTSEIYSTFFSLLWPAFDKRKKTNWLASLETIKASNWKAWLVFSS